jgi:hypothetical protein
MSHRESSFSAYALAKDEDMAIIDRQPPMPSIVFVFFDLTIDAATAGGNNRNSSDFLFLRGLNSHSSNLGSNLALIGYNLYYYYQMFGSFLRMGQFV